MVRASILVVTLLTTSALAQPRTKGVPTRTVACVPHGATLHQDDGDAAVCWSGGCFHPFHATPKLVQKPAATPAWTSPTAEVKDGQVCLGSTCKRLGKKLVAAIARARAEARGDEPVRLLATTDLQAVVVDRAAWSVAGDKPLVLGGTKEARPEIVRVSVAGKLLVVDWTTCAGPCTTMLVYDSRGRARSGEEIGGGDILQLGDRAFAVVAEYAAVHVFDLATGKLRAKVALDGEPDGQVAVRTGDDSLVVMFGPGTETETVVFARLGLLVDGPRVTIGTLDRRTLPRCP